MHNIHTYHIILSLFPHGHHFCIQYTISLGVFIEFKGNRLNSSSVVRLTDIGEQPSDPASQNDTVRGDALVCVTDNIACCRTVDGADVMGDGSWLFPNGDEVPGIGGSATNMGIYRNRGTSLVRLNRQADSTQMTTGDYCCEVPDREGDTQRVCVNVGELSPLTPNLTTRYPITTKQVAFESPLITQCLHEPIKYT